MNDMFSAVQSRRPNGGMMMGGMGGMGKMGGSAPMMGTETPNRMPEGENAVNIPDTLDSALRLANRHLSRLLDNGTGLPAAAQEEIVTFFDLARSLAERERDQAELASPGEPMSAPARNQAPMPGGHSPEGGMS